MRYCRMTAVASLGAFVSGAFVSLCLFSPTLSAQTPPPEVLPSPDAGSALSIELIDPEVLRVCADPNNMPFSTQGEAGFENKLAELVARKLGKRLSYTWYPQTLGFVRNTLGAYRCDVVMGSPQGAELVQGTNPYYRTAYALVFKPGIGLDGVDHLADPRLKDKHIGIVAGTPPATLMAMYGLMAGAKPYQLVVDTRVDSPARDMIRDIEAGVVDAGVLWGPIAGYYAKQHSPPFTVVPLVKEQSGPRLAYRITMGVRMSDQEWKRTLNRLIQENQIEINKILIDFGVPLLDEQNRSIATTGAGK
ncbi:substrate-binding domain-containing protein [Xanthobacteraceae bacterium Astr-EGSB]|uniref:substrate-binding domain-containing protein n=1 Tax=Astrobacterium formosum TaxID=3069710 RepID=UPI0027B5107A|nr:substrate-binding domain-containing protein [Xanthobacteraceae bacterium Astr-EGSB]